MIGSNQSRILLYRLQQYYKINPLLVGSYHSWRNLLEDSSFFHGAMANPLLNCCQRYVVNRCTACCFVTSSCLERKRNVTSFFAHRYCCCCTISQWLLLLIVTLAESWKMKATLKTNVVREDGCFHERMISENQANVFVV